MKIRLRWYNVISLLAPLLFVGAVGVMPKEFLVGNIWVLIAFAVLLLIDIPFLSDTLCKLSFQSTLLLKALAKKITA